MITNQKIGVLFLVVEIMVRLFLQNE